MRDDQLVLNRDYHQIFTGTNQEYGYDTPVIAFEGDTTLQILRSDKNTYFHYPDTATIVPLSAAGIIESGGIPGTIPYYSDKIWKKNANYKQHIHWGDSSTPQTGVWLCAWLSASPIPQESPVWMDRYYLPGEVIDGTYYFNSSAVYDEPSTLTLEPGVWYRYNHIGANQNEHFVSTLSGANPGEEMVLFIPDWESSTPYGEISVTSDILLQDSFTVSVLANTQSWLSPDHTSVVSRGFRGGWDLKITNGLSTPIGVIASGDGLIWINGNGSPFISKALPASFNIISVVVDDEQFTWVLGSTRMYKVDYNDTISLEVIHGATTPGRVFLNDSYQPCILDQDNGNVTVYTKLGAVDAVYLGTAPTAFADFTSTLERSDYKFESQNADARWEIGATGVKKVTIVETQEFLTSFSIKDFVIDELDNLCVLADDDTYIYFDTSANIVKHTAVLPSSEVGVRRIELLYTTPLSSRSVVLITHETAQRAYIAQHTGELVRIISTSPFNLAPSNISTGFSSNRRYKYNAYDKTNQVVGTIYFADSSGQFISHETVRYSCGELSPGGDHQFSLVYHHNTNRLELYVDAILRSSVSTPPSSVPMYTYETPIFVNTWPGRLNSLVGEIRAPWLNTTNRGISDVRIYSFPLTPYELRLILNNHLPFYDIEWNLPTGLQSYLEDIQRMFKNKLPGLKTAYYNITLTGLSITDLAIRATIEEAIKTSVKRIAPAYTNLLRIKWDDR